MNTATMSRAHEHLVYAVFGDFEPVSAPAPLRTVSPRVSASKAKRIVAGYEAGKTVYDLPDEHSLHRTTISFVLKRNGVRLRLQSPTEEQVNEMIRLYGEGLSLKRVGERLGFDAGTVRNYLGE